MSLLISRTEARTTELFRQATDDRQLKAEEQARQAEANRQAQQKEAERAEAHRKEQREEWDDSEERRVKAELEAAQEKAAQETRVRLAKKAERKAQEEVEARDREQQRLNHQEQMQATHVATGAANAAETASMRAAAASEQAATVGERNAALLATIAEGIARLRLTSSIPLVAAIWAGRVSCLNTLLEMPHPSAHILSSSITVGEQMPLIKKFGDEMPDVAKKSLPTDKGRTLPCRPASAPALTPAPSGRTTCSGKPVAAPAPRSSARASRSKTAAPPPSSARAPQVVYPAQQGGVLFSTLMMTLLSTDSAAWREKMSLFKEQARSIHTPPLAPPRAHHQCTPPPQMIKTLDNANRAGKLPEALEKLLPALISNLTRHLTHSAGGAGEPHTPEEGQARSSPPHALASLARPLPAFGVLSQAWLLPAPRQLLVATLSAVTALSAEYKTDFATSAVGLLPTLLKLADSRARHPYSTLSPPPRRPAPAKLAWRLRLVLPFPAGSTGTRKLSKMAAIDLASLVPTPRLIEVLADVLSKQSDVAHTCACSQGRQELASVYQGFGRRHSGATARWPAHARRCVPALCHARRRGRNPQFGRVPRDAAGAPGDDWRAAAQVPARLLGDLRRQLRRVPTPRHLAPETPHSSLNQLPRGPRVTHSSPSSISCVAGARPGGHHARLPGLQGQGAGDQDRGVVRQLRDDGEADGGHRLR